MNSKIVRYKPEDILPMTEEEIAALKARLDDPNFVIDTSDAPEMTDEQWASAKKRRSPLAQKAHSTV